ncbi:hypothetical protein P3S67_011070 [Capsicum chacoense]
MEEGCDFVRVEDRDVALASGPHTLNNQLMILKAWVAGFDFSAEVLTTLPIWIVGHKCKPKDNNAPPEPRKPKLVPTWLQEPELELQLESLVPEDFPPLQQGANVNELKEAKATFNTTKSSLCPALTSLAGGTHSPWLLIGDCNAILDIDDRVLGCSIQDDEVKDFAQFLEDNSQTEIKSVGRKYTWSNDYMHSKIDRAIVNVEWMQQYPHLKEIIMDPGCSDHYLVAIHVGDSQQNCRKPFKFFNVLADHASFTSVVQQAWSKHVAGKAISKVRNTLKLVKRGLKSMHSTAAQALPAIDPNVMKRGPVLTRSQQLDLIKPSPERRLQML